MSSVFSRSQAVVCIYRKVRDWVSSRRARCVYYTTSLEYETEIESGGCA